MIDSKLFQELRFDGLKKLAEANEILRKRLVQEEDWVGLHYLSEGIEIKPVPYVFPTEQIQDTCPEGTDHAISKEEVFDRIDNPWSDDFNTENRYRPRKTDRLDLIMAMGILGLVVLAETLLGTMAWLGKAPWWLVGPGILLLSGVVALAVEVVREKHL